jgi:hypothetical protein
LPCLPAASATEPRKDGEPEGKEEGREVRADQRLTPRLPGWSDTAGEVGINDTTMAELGYLRGKWLRCRRLEARGLDSFGREATGGEAELLGIWASLGEASNSGAIRRPELG